MYTQIQCSNLCSDRWCGWGERLESLSSLGGKQRLRLARLRPPKPPAWLKTLPHTFPSPLPTTTYYSTLESHLLVLSNDVYSL